MELSSHERELLIRAKFTLKQISDLQIKFYNLFRVHPMYNSEVSELIRLRKENQELIELLKKS